MDLTSKQYTVYVGGIRMPITPAKINFTYKNNNETATIMNGSEINIRNPEGLFTIEMDFRIYHTHTPYAINEIDSEQMAVYPALYMEILQNLKRTGKYFDLFIDKNDTSPANWHYTVTIADMSYVQDAEDNSDYVFTVQFQQYIDYHTQRYKPAPTNNDTPTPNNKVVPDNKRPDGDNKPKAKTYTVKRYDSLSTIAERFLGDGTKKGYDKLYNMNKKTMDEHNKRNKGSKYEVWVGEVLVVG